jgi:predicted nucleic acid-binding protein
MLNFGLKNLENFLMRFEIVSLNETIAETAIDLLRRYRLSHGLLIPDSLIAASAITCAIPLLSKNQKDYRFIEKLNLLSYP